MSLDEYQEPKGAYFTAALVAHFDEAGAAEAAVGALRDAGFTTRDIQIGRGHGHWHQHAEDHHVTVIVSEPTPGMLEEARRVLTASNAVHVGPYGAGG